MVNQAFRLPIPHDFLVNKWSKWSLKEWIYELEQSCCLTSEERISSSGDHPNYIYVECSIYVFMSFFGTEGFSRCFYIFWPSGIETSMFCWAVVPMKVGRLKHIWGFPKMVVPPVIIHFIGFSLTKTIQRTWGTPICRKPPLNCRSLIHQNQITCWSRKPIPSRPDFQEKFLVESWSLQAKWIVLQTIYPLSLQLHRRFNPSISCNCFFHVYDLYIYIYSNSSKEITLCSCCFNRIWLFYLHGGCKTK